MDRADRQEEKLAAAAAALEEAAKAVLEASQVLAATITEVASYAAGEDYPAEQQEYDRRALAAADRERAAGRDVRIPGAIVAATNEGTHPVEAWRRYRGKSQDDLARESGMGQAAISRIVNRRVTPRPGTLAKLAGALDVPVEALADHWEG